MNLKNLCNYYLDCISREQENEVSEVISSVNETFFNLEQIPLYKIIPFDSLKLLSKQNKFKNNRFMVGYPTLFKWKKSNHGNSYCSVIPLFLFEADELSLKKNQLTINDKYAHFNISFLKSLNGCGEQESNLIIISNIYEKLNINDSIDNSDLDTIIGKLQEIYPEWKWNDNFESTKLRKYDNSERFETGIYNFGFLFDADFTKYTKGLEYELLELSKMKYLNIEGTQLSKWLFPSKLTEDVENEKFEIIEPFSTNDQQRLAIQNSLTKSLTVIDGPPGTGKSQVVSNIILNAAYHGQSVLFSSKNHKAVDVVIDKIKNISDSNILVRLGKDDDIGTLLMYFNSLLSSTSSETNKESLIFYKERLNKYQQSIKNIDKEIVEVVAVREKISEIEIQIEDFLKSYPKILKYIDNQKLNDNDVAEGFYKSFSNLNKELRVFKVNNINFITKIKYFFFRRKINTNFYNKISAINNLLSLIDYVPNLNSKDNLDLVKISEDITVISGIKEQIELTKEYTTLLNQLESANISDKIRRKHELNNKVNNLSKTIWNLWIQVKKDSLINENRDLIGRFITLLNTIRADRYSSSKEVWSSYFNLLPSIIKLVPSWAVTLLSAKSTIPMIPQLFDIVIIDEASQCDIASLLPILFRAKRAVILGDPMQLSHITSVNKALSDNLMKKHDLTETMHIWSYENSAYTLSSLIGVNLISLNEHYRSHPDIINFSNNKFYDNKLIILTNNPLIIQKDRIISLDVKGSTIKPPNGSYYNQEEVKKTVQALERLTRYNQNFSIGVITPFRAQANKIRDFINKNRELTNQLLHRDFICDTVHKFQGVEKDIIIYSSVLSKNYTKSMEDFLKHNRELFNVAITRARNHFIFIGDVEICKNSNVDYYNNFLLYTQKLLVSKPESKVTPESIWEKRFYEELCKHDIHPLCQYNIINYRLDFALMIGDRKLNIEIDGEMFHKTFSGGLTNNDLIRDRRLMELGWDVMRFWSSELNYDINACTRKIINWINNQQ
jgi:superfamily I DNA and/or RNA helicase